MTATRVRLAGGIAVLLALGVLSGLLPPAPAQPGTSNLAVVIPGTGRTLLICPNGAPKADARTLDLGVYPVRPPEQVTGDTQLAARQMSGGDDPEFDELDVTLAARGRSVSTALGADGVGVLVDGQGELAQGLWASVSSSATKGESAGLAVAGCLAASPEYLFTGLSERQGQHAQVQLVNPDQIEARVDLELYDADGPLPNADSRRGISVPGGDRRTLDLDDLAAGSKMLTARVKVTTGRVGAFALQSAEVGETTGGSDWAAPGDIATSLVLPGVSPSAGGVRLAVATLGQDSGTATIEVIDTTGAHRPSGHETLRLSPGQVKEVVLSDVFDGGAASVRVTGDVDLTAGLAMTAGPRLTSGDAPRPGDLALAGPAVPLRGAVVFAGRTGATRTAVQLTALGKDTSAVVRIREPDGSVVSTKIVSLKADTTSRVDLGTSAGGRQVVVSPADPDVVVAAATFEAAGRQPQVSVLPLG
jgi:Family of unknown function (DUF5719)